MKNQTLLFNCGSTEIALKNKIMKVAGTNMMVHLEKAENDLTIRTC